MTRRARVMRIVGCVLALALGAGGTWFVATGDTVRIVRLGILAGLWGLLLGAFALYGARPAAAVATEPGERTYDPRLEDILRREIRSSVSRELTQLRAQVALLRSDLMDRLPGHVEFERTETVRVVGDLETVQEELRRRAEAVTAVAGEPATIEQAPAEAPAPTAKQADRRRWSRRSRGRHAG